MRVNLGAYMDMIRTRICFQYIYLLKIITINTAVRLTKALNSATKYWMEQQVDYDIEQLHETGHLA